jgi:preprotein translocase YajC subunit
MSLRDMSQFKNTPDLSYLMLSQSASSDAPVLSGQGGESSTGTTGADGDGAAQGAAAPAGGPNFMILLIPAIGFLLLMSIMGGRKEKKRRKQLEKISKHDRIRTRGGIIGSVVEATGDQIVIKVDEGKDTRITLDRQYVDAILEDGSESE